MGGAVCEVCVVWCAECVRRPEEPVCPAVRAVAGRSVSYVEWCTRGGVCDVGEGQRECRAVCQRCASNVKDDVAVEVDDVSDKKKCGES